MRNGQTPPGGSSRRNPKSKDEGGKALPPPSTAVKKRLRELEKIMQDQFSELQQTFALELQGAYQMGSSLANNASDEEPKLSQRLLQALVTMGKEKAELQSQTAQMKARVAMLESANTVLGDLAGVDGARMGASDRAVPSGGGGSGASKLGSHHHQHRESNNHMSPPDTGSVASGTIALLQAENLTLQRERDASEEEKQKWVQYLTEHNADVESVLYEVRATKLSLVGELADLKDQRQAFERFNASLSLHMAATTSVGSNAPLPPSALLEELEHAQDEIRQLKLKNRILVTNISTLQTQHGADGAGQAPRNKPSTENRGSGAHSGRFTID